jgi:hypothetical protein
MDMPADLRGGALDIATEHRSRNDIEREVGKNRENVERLPGNGRRLKLVEGIPGALNHHIEDGIETATVESRLNEFTLASPEIAFAGHETVTHEDAEYDVTLAFLLIFGIAVNEDLPSQFRRANEGGLANQPLESKNVAEFFEPFWKLTQRITPGVVNGTAKPMAGGCYLGRKSGHCGRDCSRDSLMIPDSLSNWAAKIRKLGRRRRIDTI